MNRTYAVGDVHGCHDLLMKAFNSIADDAEAHPDDEFQIVMLGDYVDRGPDSAEVVSTLMQWEAKLIPGSFVCLKGNHESMMLMALRHEKETRPWWERNGGRTTLASYASLAATEAAKLLSSHLDWVEKLPTGFLDLATSGRFYVHAGCHPSLPLEQQTEEHLLWIRDRFLDAEDEFRDWPHIVHGHSPTHLYENLPAGEPALLNWRTNLDTGAFYTGVLTVGVFDGHGGPCTRTIKVTCDP